MHTKAMSTGFSLASCCASVTCSARTATVNSATSLACVTRSPCFLICSTCSGQGSMNVTSSPACTIWAPAYPPTAPAPTMAILWPIAVLPASLTAEGSVPAAPTTTGRTGTSRFAPDRQDLPLPALPCNLDGARLRRGRSVEVRQAVFFEKRLDCDLADEILDLFLEARRGRFHRRGRRQHG